MSRSDEGVPVSVGKGGFTIGEDGKVLQQKSTFYHSSTVLPLVPRGTSFVRSDKGCKTLFLVQGVRKQFRWCHPSGFIKPKATAPVKNIPNLRAQHFSSSSFPTVGYSTAQFTARSTKETALFYNSDNLLNLSNTFVCTLTAVYSDSRDPLTKRFNQENAFIPSARLKFMLYYLTGRAEVFRFWTVGRNFAFCILHFAFYNRRSPLTKCLQ